MTDYRDPNYREPARPVYPAANAPVDSESWSSSTWGWIAGLAVVALVLIFAFSGGRDANHVATDSTNPPVTTGQGSSPASPPAIDNGAPKMSRPAPAPAPAPAAPQQ
jgi:hypothetical protein